MSAWVDIDLDVGHLVRMKHTLGERELKLVLTMYECYVCLKLEDYYKYQATLFARNFYDCLLVLLGSSLFVAVVSDRCLSLAKMLSFGMLKYISKFKNYSCNKILRVFLVQQNPYKLAYFW